MSLQLATVKTTSPLTVATWSSPGTNVVVNKTVAGAHTVGDTVVVDVLRGFVVLIATVA